MVSENPHNSSSSLQIICEFGERQNGPKRKRHKARVSCLNCYASKRKCDKKRPCARCIRLGLTELCIYEHTNPVSRNSGHSNEITRLKNRIAELESVISELRDRPNPHEINHANVLNDLGGLLPLRHRFIGGDQLHAASIEASFATGEKSSADPFMSPEHRAPVRQLRPFVHTPSGSDTLESNISYYSYSPPISSSGEVPPQEWGYRSSMSACLLSMGGDPNSFSSSSSKLKPDPFCPSLSPSSNDEVLRSPSDTSIGAETPCISSPTSLPLSSSEEVCQCLSATPALHPLLHFAIALRTSREALQALHSPASHCALFRRIIELDDHIFSASPPTPSVNRNLTHSPDVAAH